MILIIRMLITKHIRLIMNKSYNKNNNNSNNNKAKRNKHFKTTIIRS